MRGRLRPWGLALLAVIVAAALGPLPAPAASAAAPLSAGERCRLNTEPDASTTLHLSGGRGQTYPAQGLPRLGRGDVVRIEPDQSDIVDVSLLSPADAWDLVTPAGNPRAAGSGYPAPLANQYSLVGWFGGAPIQVSRPSSCLMPSVETATLAINDPEAWDNTGAWDVVVKLYRAPVRDGGFESQTSRAVSAPWGTEGPDVKGVDINLGFAHTGRNNAFIVSAGREWNAIVQQIPVRRNTNYLLRGFIRTSGNINTAFFGVRLPGMWPPVEEHFGPSPAGAYQQIDKPFNSLDNDTVTVFAGFWGVGSEGWIQIDNVSVLLA
ncbi:hypothetical protein GCM10010517_74210 [Streptosporangium fragile]|uniref:Uncharacterized protein n=1 Tax=Streptosporangium fragile TaxID=46186 RepID=A0ABN3W975_9ACTN